MSSPPPLAIRRRSPWQQAPKPDPAKFLTQPLVRDLYTADPSAHVFNGKIFIYPVARHRCRRARRRSRQPLRDARLSRLLDGADRRAGHRSRRRARHQERALGRPSDVGAGRRRERRQVLPVLSGEGQAGRLPDRRRRRRQPRRPVHGRSRSRSPAASASTRPCSRTAMASPTCTSAASGADSCSAGRLARTQAEDIYPAKDQPALSAKIARLGDDMMSLCGSAERRRAPRRARQAAHRRRQRPPLLRSLVGAQVQRHVLLLVLDRRHALHHVRHR